MSSSIEMGNKLLIPRPKSMYIWYSSERLREMRDALKGFEWLEGDDLPCECLNGDGRVCEVYVGGVIRRLESSRLI